ncbi:sensor histidine kinase [Chitinophaga agri]|uniref:Signal transduction histidine kinase internal region domain-containing protein n=1 Tax=Chitinophaga agri TaxID=2703787 RepID=A0A6B9ZP47_9BACT|nr:sensor histidine kinase [Chitinophaga agri]QHS63706.1 hypothetical protein GWR21_30235 [Chitinophaga agri]
MDALKEKGSFVIRGLEVWLFVGLLIWVVILGQRTMTWELFGSHMAALGLPELPVLLFTWYSKPLQARLTNTQYQLVWWGVFAVMLPLLSVCSCYYHPSAVTAGHYLTNILCCISLGVLLVASSYYQREMRHVSWIRRISLDKAVLISLALIALLLSVMAVSSLNNPRYHTKDQLLIGYEFSPVKIITHFGLFIALLAQFLFMYCCGYALYYLNSRVLVAQILKRRGIIFYLMSVFALVAVLYPFIGQLLAWMPINSLLGGIFDRNPFVLENSFGALMIMFASLPIVLAIQWTRQNNRIVALEQEKTKTELDLLKQQLNPHFFFNTLNNLYALSLQRSKQTPDSILQLSELMRYVIYKGQEERVTIKEELKYIEDYMDLQQMRLRQKPDVHFIKDIEDETQMLAPMLLIVFIENAFKHGIEPAEEQAFLRIQLICRQGKIHLICENSVEPGNTTTRGIGLTNLRKRLELLYPGRYQLETGIKNHTFKAVLQLYPA